MLDNAYMIKKCLDEMRGMVQQNRMNNERARETNVRKTFEEDDPMYGDAVKAQYGMGEVKRRRGVSFQIEFRPMIERELTQAAARSPSRPMSQLQQDRHSRMEARP